MNMFGIRKYASHARNYTLYARNDAFYVLGVYVQSFPYS